MYTRKHVYCRRAGCISAAVAAAALLLLSRTAAICSMNARAAADVDAAAADEEEDVPESRGPPMPFAGPGRSAIATDAKLAPMPAEPVPPLPLADKEPPLIGVDAARDDAAAEKAGVSRALKEPEVTSPLLKKGWGEGAADAPPPDDWEDRGGPADGDRLGHPMEAPPANPLPPGPAVVGRVTP